VAISFSFALADIVLSDCDGQEIRLGSLWEQQIAILVFLRQYG
jgi:hypothetical protein